MAGIMCLAHPTMLLEDCLVGRNSNNVLMLQATGKTHSSEMGAALKKTYRLAAAAAAATRLDLPVNISFVSEFLPWH